MQPAQAGHAASFVRVAVFALALACLAARSTAQSPGGAHYANDFEERLDLEEWCTVAKYELRALRLVDEKRRGGKRCAKLDYTVTGPGHRSYFQVPMAVEYRRSGSYVVDGWLLVEAPEYVSVSLGVNWRIAFGGKSTDGCYAVTSGVEGRGKWVRLLSRDLCATLADDIHCRGYSPRSKMTIIGVYLSILGRVREGDRVTVYLDDLALTPATDAIEADWAREDARMREELDYAGSPVTETEKAFVWGVGGSLQGLSSVLELSLDTCAAVMARDWQENFFDSCLRMGGLIRANRPASQEDDLGRLLDVTAKHGFRMQVSVYLSGYSKSNAFDPSVDRDECEKVLKRVVTRFRDHPGLLGWYILDEPRPEWPALRDHWIWAKKRIEAIDQRRPVTAALNRPSAVRFYAPHSAVVQIDWYPIALRSGHADDQLFGHGAMTGGAMCDAARESGARTIWFIPQAYSCMRKRRLPTPAEVRLQTYLPLAHGATGILYYQYQHRPLWHVSGGERMIADIVFRRRSPMGEEVRRLGRVIPVIGPVLVGAEYVAETGIEVEAPALPDFGVPAIEVRLLRGPDYDVVAACNLDVENQQKAELRLPPNLLAGRGLWDLHAQAPANAATGGAVTVELAPGDGRFLALAPEPVARRLFREISARHLEKLSRLYWAELAEGQAAGAEPTRAQGLWRDGQALLERGAGVEAVKRLEQARQALAEALAAHKPYAKCRRRIDALQSTISDANWEFENHIIEVPWQRNTNEYSQPRRVAAAMYKPYGDLILCAAKMWYRLRYGLMMGRTEQCHAALPACERLADQTRRLVAELREGKRFEKPGMWLMYHPITARLRALMDECETKTAPLEGSHPQ